VVLVRCHLPRLSLTLTLSLIWPNSRDLDGSHGTRN
jgi:hypothetical protein